MLTIEVPEREFYNEVTGEFDYVSKTTLQLEHSLISLSKWESKWKKAFLDQNNLTRAELLDYIRCMTINQHVDPKAYSVIPAVELERVKEYIADPHTATTIYDTRPNTPGPKQIITSELIYWQMIYCGVPFECEKWHLNRLMTLLRICNIKGTNTQMSMEDIFAQNKMLNAARRGGKR